MGSFKLGKMTLGSLFKRPETILYPIEPVPHPDALRGHVDIVNPESCILCSMCKRKCPTSAIEVDKQERTWSIDWFRCITCNECVIACPKECLEMSTERPEPAMAKSAHVVHIPEAAPQEEVEA